QQSFSVLLRRWDYRSQFPSLNLGVDYKVNIVEDTPFFLDWRGTRGCRAPLSCFEDSINREKMLRKHAGNTRGLMTARGRRLAEKIGELLLLARKRRTRRT